MKNDDILFIKVWCECVWVEVITLEEGEGEADLPARGVEAQKKHQESQNQKAGPYNYEHVGSSTIKLSSLVNWG